MTRPFDPAKRYVGALCLRHPEMGGLRQRSNSTCIQCQRDTTSRRQEQRRADSGKQKREPMTPEVAASRIRERDKLRGKVRRQDHEYAAQQIERKRAWRANNRERHLATSRAYEAKQLAENLQRRLSKNLRHRLRKAMLGHTRGVSAVRDLGMSIAEFRLYIATKFTPGMSWGNYGEWHLDHIRPLALFDLSDGAQARAACHYSNLQPLWALDNQRKWCKPHRKTWDALHANALEYV